MADVIQQKDLDRLVSRASSLINENRFTAIEIIKKVIDIESCSLSEAKEAYLLATNNETLGEYQERVFLPIIKELNELEKEE